MAARVEFLVATKYDGTGFNSAVAGATKLDQAQQKTSRSAAGLADSVGKVSTTLARSVGIFGLSSTSLRAIDDAADIAELGLRGVEGGMNQVITKTTAFSAATVGAAGAAAAFGFAIGSWLAKIPAVANAMDKLVFAIMGVDKALNEASMKGGVAGQAEKHAEAQRKQLEAMKAAGATAEQIKKNFGGTIPEALQASVKAFSEAEAAAKRYDAEISAMASEASGEKLAQDLQKWSDAVARVLASGKMLTPAAQEEISKMVGEGIAQGVRIPDNLIPIQQAEIARQIEEIVKGAVAKVKTGTGEDLWKDLLGGGLTGGFMEGPGGKTIQDEIDRAAEGQKAIEAGIRANEQATFDWAQQLENVANMAGTLPGVFGQAFSAILGGISGIGASLKNIGGGKGLLGALTGGAGLGGILAGGGVVGSIISGAVGIFKGIKGLFGGDDKKKAEELKQKQQAAIDSFTDLYEQWVQMRRDIAMKGAEGVNTLIGSMFEDGEFNEKFTSAANAAEYVAAQFSAMLAAGIPITEILEKLGPALDAMGKEAKKFAGTAAAPLIQLAKVAKENEALLNFQRGLADTAVSLASFGLLTQDLATKMSIDLGNSIDELTAKFGGGESGYMQALRLSADSLYKLQQAAEKGQVTLDDHTQKMIDDAKSAGLFEGLQDPMQQLIEINNAMLATMGQLVSLMGGAVPAAIQAMIDAFNSAQFSAPSGEPGAPGGGPGAPGSPPELPQKPQPQFAEGGYLPERQGGHSVRVAETGTGGEWMIPNNQLAEIMGMGAGEPVNITIYTLPHQDPREIAEFTNREFRNNRRGRYTQNLKGRK